MNASVNYTMYNDCGYLQNCSGIPPVAILRDGPAGDKRNELMSEKATGKLDELAQHGAAAQAVL